MRYLKWASWIILIIFFITGTTTTYQPTEEKQLAKMSKMMSSNTSMIDNNYESEFPGLHLRTKTADTGTYTMSISVPTAKADEINKPIWGWIDQQKEEFLSEIKEIKDPALLEKNIAHLNIQLETNKLENDRFSLIFSVDKYVGGANGETNIQPFIIDIKEGKILRLHDLFDTNEKLSEQLYQLIIEQINDDPELEPFVFFDDLKDSLNDFGKFKWSISEEHLTIHFNKYEIAAGAAGPLTFNIPLEHLKPYFKEDFLEQDNIDLENEPEEVEKEDEEKADPDNIQKYVALTFDDGPSADVTPLILDILEQHDAKATFFMLGSQVEYYPAIAKQVIEQGHEIGNHTNNHPDLTKLSYAEIENQFDVTQEKIKQATGATPTLLRPPYGAYNDHVLNYANHYQNSITLWSVDSLDWQSRNANAVYDKIIQNTVNGAVILMHDIHPSTAEALPEVLETLADDGYEFVTVSELLELQGKDGSGPHSGGQK